MTFSRSAFLVILAFLFAVLAALTGGGIITSSDLQWQWLIPASLASYYLSLLVP